VLLGLVLAALGIYGVTYRGVVDRTREFAIRLALASESPGILRMVVMDALKDVVAGAVVGVAGGLLVCGLLARLVSHVAPADARITAASLGALMIAAMVAALVPAVRVLRVDPAEALRTH
jgi:ABC-type antimicrobial peptide transport system permease subunit